MRLALRWRGRREENRVVREEPRATEPQEADVPQPVGLAEGKRGRLKTWFDVWPAWPGWIVLRIYKIGRWWLSILLSTIRRFDEHDCEMRAAAISYYALISFFPLVLLLIVTISYFLESTTAQKQVIEFVEASVPTSADLVRGNIQQILRIRGAIGALALLGFLWSALAVFSTIDRAINRIWDVPTLRPYWRGKLVALLVIIAIGALTLISIGMTTLVNFIRDTVLPILVTRFDVDPGPWRLLILSMPYLMSIVLFMFIYKVFPHTRISLLDVWPGAFVAGFLWEEAKHLFTDYLNTFGRYNLVYGSVGAIIALLVWFYLTALILLIGAELSAAYTRARRRGRIWRPQF